MEIQCVSQWLLKQLNGHREFTSHTGIAYSHSVLSRAFKEVHRLTYPSVLPDSRICRTLILMRLGTICCYQHCSLLGNASPFIYLRVRVTRCRFHKTIESCKERVLWVFTIYFCSSSSWAAALSERTGISLTRIRLIEQNATRRSSYNRSRL